MELEGPNTPGLRGYVVAWATSVVVLAVLLLLMLEPDPVPAQAIVWNLVFLVPASSPFAVAGVLLVHHVCREERRQWLHVLVAGAAGAMAGGFVTLVNVGFVVLVPAIAASTAIGRLVVVPMVWQRRNSAASAVTG